MPRTPRRPKWSFCKIFLYTQTEPYRFRAFPPPDAFIPLPRVPVLPDGRFFLRIFPSDSKCYPQPSRFVQVVSERSRRIRVVSIHTSPRFFFISSKSVRKKPLITGHQNRIVSSCKTRSIRVRKNSFRARFPVRTSNAINGVNVRWLRIRFADIENHQQPTVLCPNVVWTFCRNHFRDRLVSG